jgi:hypothetical protein
VTLKGDVVSGAPRYFNVIPGPWWLNNSDYEEWNHDSYGCQAHQICEQRIILKDEAGNYVNQSGLFTTEDADF